jgi:MFS family permease
MSEYLSAAAQALRAPEELVLRSASARAEADGLSVDDILQMWAGGTTVAAPGPEPTVAAPVAPELPAAEPALEEPAPVAEAAVAEPALEERAPVAEAAVAEPALEERAPVVVEIVEEPVPEGPVEVPPLGERLRSPATLGALTGTVLALVGLLLASSRLIDAASVTSSEPPSPAVLVTTSSVIIGVAAVSVVFGALAAVLARNLPAYGNPGAHVATSWVSALFQGAIVGVILGAITAALLLAVLGETVESTVDGEAVTRVLLPVRGLLFLLVLGGAVLGSVAAMIPHVLGLPVALSPQQQEEPVTIRRRLTTAFGLPVMAALTIGLLVVSFAAALLTWPTYAPFLAATMAVSILGFAALMRVRPGTRVSRGDIYAALSGIAVIFLVILVALATFTGDGEEGPEGGEDTESYGVVRVVS